MKKLICLVLAFVMLFSMTALADSQKNAEMLKELNLFKGTDKGFELEREASRVEAIVTVVRVLGGEAEALEKKYPHSFNDTDSWMDPYVGYALEKGITKGVSENSFAPNDLITSNQFVTLILRAMNYKDAEGDFNWEKSVEFAKEINIDASASSEFTRGDMVDICFSALNAFTKGNEEKLYQKLAKDNVFTTEKFTEVTGISEKYVPKAEIAEVKDNKQGIYTATLDDGITNHASKMGNFAKKYGFKFTSYISTKNCASDSFSPTFWNNLVKSGYMSIGNHGYDHVRIGELSDEEYEKQTVFAVEDMYKYFPGSPILTYATPFTGAVTRYDIVKDVIYANRSGGGNGFNPISPKQPGMFNLASCVIKSDTEVATLVSQLKEAHENNYWYIQMWHGFDDISSEYCLDSAVAEEFFKALPAYKDKMWFATMDDAVKYIYEKQNVTVNIEGDEKKVKISLTDTLPDNKFDMPLTVKLKAPNGISSASVTIKGIKETVEVSGGFVIFNLLPDKETAEITF